MAFSTKLKELRKEHNLTQENLASAIAVSRTLITKYESGAVYPTEDNLKRIAEYFNVSVKDLITEEESTSLTLNTVNYLSTFKKVFTILMFIVSFLIVIFLILPVFKYAHYVYPIPDGQLQPDFVHGYASLIAIHFAKNNYLALITLIISLISVVFSIVSLFVNKKIIFIITLFIFVIVIFLFLFTFFNGVSLVSASDFQLNGRVDN